MVTLEKIQSEMTRLLEDDMARVCVDVSADTLEKALNNASVELGLPIRHIDYEVIQKGSSGFFAFSQKKWKIRAYKSVLFSKAEKKHLKDDSDEEKEAASAPVDKDGAAFVFLGKDGVYLKVTAPIGMGKRVSLKDAYAALSARNINNASDDEIRAIVSKQEGAYGRVGPYEYNPANSPLLSVEIAEDEMQAWIYVSPPGPGGADISADEIISFLNKSRVTVGIDEKRVSDFVDSPVYRTQYLVAEGVEAVDGNDAWIQYNFEIDSNKINLKETAEGRIDFKELNIVQNVMEGQALAKKIEAQRGRGGKTVTGKYLEAKNGKDIRIPLGKNTQLADDGVTILATVNGQAILRNNKINVEPILNIPGDVSLKTGNIMFLGTVNINGSVEDGFTVKATGNIEIKGSVGKAVLDAEGDIIVGRGVMGKGEGSIRAGKSVWARFIENANVDAGECVIVSDGIVNCQVVANQKIICQGKRAVILGGNLVASEEIQAKTLGSPSAGSETVLNVGFDPKSKARLDSLTLNKGKKEKELSEVKLNYNTFINQKKEKIEFSEEKEQQLKALSERKYVLENEINELDSEIANIQNYLATIRTRGKVYASSKVYAGVKIAIRDVVEDVRMDCGATTFYLDSGLIRYGKYQPPDSDKKRAPDGYISD